jgi:selenocysteine lyase/cysteine desulfurase
MHRSNSKKKSNKRKNISNDIFANNVIKLDIDIPNRKITNKEYNIFIELLHRKLNFDNEYNTFIFTSKFSVYNCLISSVLKSFTSIIKKKPHIISNYAESIDIQNILNFYKEKNLIDVSYIKPNIYGSFTSNEINKNIIKNKTCLIIISFVNSNLGTINNLKLIGDVAHSNNIPIFCDCNDIFGMYPINPKKNNIDAFCIDFNKLNNIKKLNILCINKDLYDGYNLHDYSTNFNNNYELDLIEYEMSKKILNNYYKTKIYRKNINKKILNIRKYFINQLTKMISENNNLYYYDEIIKNDINTKNGDIIIISSQDDSQYIPFIISFIIINKLDSYQIKKKLEKYNIFIDCDNNDKFHKFYSSIGILDKWIKKIIKLNFIDSNIKSDIDFFIKSIKNIINS